MSSVGPSIEKLKVSKYQIILQKENNLQEQDKELIQKNNLNLKNKVIIKNKNPNKKEDSLNNLAKKI